MDKKYELTDESIEYEGAKLYRIKALRDFGDVCNGDLGGFVESEKNLSHEGDCWIYDNGKVVDQGFVSGNAKILDHGEVCGYGRVLDHGEISDHGFISDFGLVLGHGKVKNYGFVSDHGIVSGHGEISGHGDVSNHGVVSGNGKVKDYATVGGYGNVLDNGEVSDCGKIFSYGIVACNGKVCGNATITGNTVVKDIDDYIVFQNNWSECSFFTWTKSNNMWAVEFFYGTGEELIRKGYEECEKSGKTYESYVRFVEENFLK